MSTPDSQRWQRIEAALTAALEVTAAQRNALLDDLCADDAALRREVDSLLAAHAHAEDFLSTSADAYAAPYIVDLSEQAVSSDGAGSLIGRYRLIEEIGRGGMGTVWLAERADGHFEQRVALKLIKRGMDSDEILARFIRERQILARLEHPDIARLLDGGISDDGRPYFVMEHVQGVPLTQSCDQQQLAIEDRLLLFARVCRAVQYAHRNLVVHRDIKPSNVLVTENGEVKLLDFGVAKLLSDDTSGEPTLTALASSGPMTPEYASPEQMTGQPVTTASDVYQLGVLFYELLTGHRPYRLSGREWREKERLIREAEPQRPSTAAHTIEQLTHRDGSTETIEPEGVSSRRGTTPERLRRRLRGDLDAIALRALRKQPEQRQPSAEALAEDVERHLAFQPLRYGDGGWSYGARKFLRRYRLRVAALTFIVIASAGFGSLYVSRIRAERERARREAVKATETAQLLGRFFQSWNPDPRARVEVPTTKLVSDATLRAERELINDPEMLAATLSLLGGLQTSLGEWQAADSLLSRAQRIQERIHQQPTTDLAGTLARRGRYYFLRGEHHAAENTLRQALELHRKLLAPRNAETLRIQLELARVLLTKRDLRSAEELLRGVLSAMDDADRATSPLALETASWLGYVLFEETRYDEAIAVLRPTLVRQRAIFGDNYLPTLQTMRSLASTLRDAGRLDEAELLYRDALRSARALYGETHSETAGSFAVLAIGLQRKEALAEAEVLFRRAMRIYEDKFGTEQYETAGMWSGLAGVLLDRGALPEAEALLRQVQRVFRRSFPSGISEDGDILNRLAYIAITRKAADADSLYRAAIAFDDARPPASPAFVSDGFHFLAWARHKQGDLVGAERNYRLALALYQRQLPHGHAYRGAAAIGLGSVLLDLGRVEEARPHLEDGLKEWQAHRPPEPQRIAEAHSLIASVKGRR